MSLPNRAAGKAKIYLLLKKNFCLPFTPTVNLPDEPMLKTAHHLEHRQSDWEGRAAQATVVHKLDNPQKQKLNIALFTTF